MRLLAIAVAVTSSTAGADPAPPSPLRVRDPAATSFVLTPLTLFEVPKPPTVPSVRLEAVRVAAERFGDNWRYPDPGPLVGLDGSGWFVGQGYYRPLSSRSGALHTGSVAATLLGEILLSADSPLAGLGALVTGVTLDAATADADRDAERRGAR